VVRKGGKEAGEKRDYWSLELQAFKLQASGLRRLNKRQGCRKYLEEFDEHCEEVYEKYIRAGYRQEERL